MTRCADVKSEGKEEEASDSLKGITPSMSSSSVGAKEEGEMENDTVLPIPSNPLDIMSCLKEGIVLGGESSLVRWRGSPGQK